MDPIQLARYDRVYDAYVKGGESFSKDCFTDHVKLLAKIRGTAEDDPATLAYIAELGNTWDGLAAIADTDRDGKITRDEWRAAAEQLTGAFIAAKEAGAPLPFMEWVGVLYRLIDADGDGRVTQQEYADWLEALDLLKDTDLDTAFAGFDKNDDGYLSTDEFASTYIEYWTVFDESVPGHRWIGP